MNLLVTHHRLRFHVLILFPSAIPLLKINFRLLNNKLFNLKDLQKGDIKYNRITQLFKLNFQLSEMAEPIQLLRSLVFLLVIS